MTLEDALVFERAAELIRAGWARGMGYRVANGVESYCALSALGEAAARLHVVNRHYKRVNFLADVIGHDESRSPMAFIIMFNDVRARDGDEVAALMDVCAEKLRAEAGAL